MAADTTPPPSAERTNTAAQRARDTRARVLASASRNRASLAETDERAVGPGTSVATRATASSAGLRSPSQDRGLRALDTAALQGGPRPITIDITSDVVCPWCFLGKRRLDKALATISQGSAAADVVIRWHPYDLDPAVPRKGEPFDVYARRRLGDADTLADSEAQLTAMGKEVGIAFDFDAVIWRPHSLSAHRVIRLARQTGGYPLQGAVVDGIMSAYFERGEDIGDTEILAEAAAVAGLNADAVRGLLGSRDDVGAVKANIRAARHRQVAGVPDIFIDGRYRITGAQQTRKFESVLQRVLALRRTPRGR